jgi:hypothetical protein
MSPIPQCHVHLVLDWVSQSLRRYQTADGDDSDEVRRDELTNIGGFHAHLQDFIQRGWLDITTENSHYDASYLRARHQMLAKHIVALNAEDE